MDYAQFLVANKYEISDGYIKPAKGSNIVEFNPLDDSELHVKMLNVKEKDTQNILEFTNKYGLLYGLPLFEPPISGIQYNIPYLWENPTSSSSRRVKSLFGKEPSRSEWFPLWLFELEVKEFKELVKLWNFIHKKETDNIKRLLRDTIDNVVKGKDNKLWLFCYEMNQTSFSGLLMSLSIDSNIIPLGVMILERAINARISGIHPQISLLREPSKQQKSLQQYFQLWKNKKEVDDYIKKLGYIPDKSYEPYPLHKWYCNSLISACYMTFSQKIWTNKRVGVCRECGSYFPLKRVDGVYCPGGKCKNRATQRDYRQSHKKK